MLAKVPRNYGKDQNRHWWGVLYPENMIEDWEDKIDEIIQRPYVYVIHDKDNVKGAELDDHERKVHLHLWVAWGNNTTGNSAARLFDKLSAPGKCCMRAGKEIEAVHNVERAYLYLCHADEKSIKKGKYRYPDSARVFGNNFDIGAYIKLSEEEKKKIRSELITFCIEQKSMNFVDFVISVRETYSDEYEDVLVCNQGLFNNLTRGNYLKYGQRNDTEWIRNIILDVMDERSGCKDQES